MSLDVMKPTATATADRVAQHNNISLHRPHAANSDWDPIALRELAETGRVASALQQPVVVSPGSLHTQQKNEDNNSRNSGLVIDGPGGSSDPDAHKKRFMVYPLLLLQHEASFDNQKHNQFYSLSTAEEAVDAAAKITGDMSGCFWLDITDPSAEDMETVARAFGIHPLTVEDILAETSDDADKLEAVDNDYAMLVYRTAATGGGGELRSSGMSGFSVVLKQELFVLSFHGSDDSEVAHVSAVVDRLATDGRGGGSSAGVMYVAYALVDDITDSLGLAMRAIELEVSQVDELVMALSVSRDKGEMLQRIGLLRRRILGIWRLLLGKPDVVRALSRLFTQWTVPLSYTVHNDGDWEKDEADNDIEHYLSDICDHLAALTNSCAHCEMVLSRTHANYMAQLTLDVGNASVDAGLFSNRWLMLAGILFPLQICVMFFGQNILVPWKSDGDEDAPKHVNLHAWFGIFSVIVGVFVTAVAWARLKKVF
ncbi:CorA metal ion transporter [Coemansia sp. RSA 1200]|nr:CorA metal ion transporter [Coemansia sp. RSA 1200]